MTTSISFFQHFLFSIFLFLSAHISSFFESYRSSISYHLLYFAFYTEDGEAAKRKLRFFAYYLHAYENENENININNNINNGIIGSNSDKNSSFVDINKNKNGNNDIISNNMINEEVIEVKEIIFSSPDTQSSGMHQLESIGFKVRTLLP